jgi:hypothetical protein
VVEISADKLTRLHAFKARYVNYKPSSWLFDVVRFSHKVFAAADALADYRGVGVWLDADCVTYKDVPENFIESHLQGAYMALFKRRGYFTETGFWIIDGDHPQHVAFMEAWLDQYESGGFRSLANWTDCETLDTTVRRFEKAGLIKTVSLSGDFEREMHPMSFVEIGKYIDHCKGARKDKGVSPENKFRKEAA